MQNAGLPPVTHLLRLLGAAEPALCEEHKLLSLEELLDRALKYKTR